MKFILIILIIIVMKNLLAFLSKGILYKKNEKNNHNPSKINELDIQDAEFEELD